jgi:hypothetical protein
MSCKAEIIVEQYTDVVYVPVQAVLRVGGQPTVYVVTKRTPEERKVEIDLDNNRMVKVSNGLTEGEIVMLTPPLKAATVEQQEKITAGGEFGSGDAVRDKIDEKLRAANGTKGESSVKQENVLEGSYSPTANIAAKAGQERSDQDNSQMPSAEQMQQMRQRLQNMTPEERQQEIEKMRQQFENMSPEQRSRMRQQNSDGTSNKEDRQQDDGQSQNRDTGQ